MHTKSTRRKSAPGRRPVRQATKSPKLLTPYQRRGAVALLQQLRGVALVIGAVETALSSALGESSLLSVMLHDEDEQHFDDDENDPNSLHGRVNASIGARGL